MKESVNLTMARKEKKKMKRGTERVHRQITHVICDSAVIKERLREEENYLSLCARHLDTKRHSVTFVTHGGWGGGNKGSRVMRLERLLEKQPVDSVTVLMLFVKGEVTCRLAQNEVISYRWRYLIIPLGGVEICICQFDIVTHFRCMETSYLSMSTSRLILQWPLDARNIITKSATVEFKEAH